jgi:type IV pilus assembly protein PilB
MGLFLMSYSLPKSPHSSCQCCYEHKRPKGCKECNNTGYKGRVGIFEAIVADDALETFVAKSPSIAELRAYVQKAGMVSMYQDGLLKVLAKITTLQEVERVTTE